MRKRKMGTRIIKGRASIFVLVTSLVLALTLTGCGGGEKNSAPTNPGDKADTASSSGSVTGNAPTNADGSAGEITTAAASMKVEVVDGGEVNIVVNTDFLKGWGDGKTVYLAFWDENPGPDSKEILVCRLDPNQKWVGVPEGDYSDVDFDIPESFPDGTVTFNVCHEGIEQMLRLSGFVELHTEDYSNGQVMMNQLIELSDASDIDALFTVRVESNNPADQTGSADISTPEPSENAKEFDYYDNGSGITISRYLGNGGSVVIPSKIDGKDVTEIAYDAFSEKGLDRAPITSIVIPNTVKKIEENAFAMCESLTDVKLPDGIEEIGYGAFYASGIKSIVIPSGIRSLGAEAFRGCQNLTSVVIPNDMKKIPTALFAACKSLKSVTIPDNVEEIGDDAFMGCTALTEVKVGSGVKSIGRTSFGICSNLERITLPDSVTQINEYAFADCEKIVVTYRGNTYDYAHIQELYAAINS